MPTARFCAFCGVKLSGETTPPGPSGDTLKTDGSAADSGTLYSSRATAHPLNDNPYQPCRAPIISRIPVKPILGTAQDTAQNAIQKEARAIEVNRADQADQTAPVALEENVRSDSASAENEAANAGTSSLLNEPVAEERFSHAAGIEAEADCPVELPFESSADVRPQESSRPQVSSRAPVLHKENKESNRESNESGNAPCEASEHSSTRVRIKSSPKRVFVFADEDEADILPRSKALKNSLYDEDDDDEDDYIEEYDGIREFDENNEFDDDEDDYDYEEEDEDEDEPSAGHIFVRVFSVLTVFLLIAGLFAFAYGTSIGRRLRASVGMSSEAADYILLADWQLAQKNLSDASDSYYNAFKLNQDNYELALTIGTGFENANDDARAESLYSYLITQYPQADEPYDRLMMLLNQQGRTAEYQSLLDYRAAQQPDYAPPVSQVSQILQTPTASHSSGAYATSLTLTLDAGGAEIRYTIDGTVPTAQSRLYTGSITLGRGTYTVRAVAVVNGIISSEWVGEFFIS